jgi:hypothetical protein
MRRPQNNYLTAYPRKALEYRVTFNTMAIECINAKSLYAS